MSFENSLEDVRGIYSSRNKSLILRGVSIFLVNALLTWTVLDIMVGGDGKE